MSILHIVQLCHSFLDELNPDDKGQPWQGQAWRACPTFQAVTAAPHILRQLWQKMDSRKQLPEPRPGDILYHGPPSQEARHARGGASQQAVAIASLSRGMGEGDRCHRQSQQQQQQQQQQQHARLNEGGAAAQLAAKRLVSRARKQQVYAMSSRRGAQPQGQGPLQCWPRTRERVTGQGRGSAAAGGAGLPAVIIDRFVQQAWERQNLLKQQQHVAPTKQAGQAVLTISSSQATAEDIEETQPHVPDMFVSGLWQPAVPALAAGSAAAARAAASADVLEDVAVSCAATSGMAGTTPLAAVGGPQAGGAAAAAAAIAAVVAAPGTAAAGAVTTAGRYAGGACATDAADQQGMFFGGGHGHAEQHHQQQEHKQQPQQRRSPQHQQPEHQEVDTESAPALGKRKLMGCGEQDRQQQAGPGDDISLLQHNSHHWHSSN